MAFLDVCLACIRPRWLLKAISAYPIGPRSVYDEAKRFSEVAVTAWRRYYGVDTHLARIFNTYRPSLQANDGRVISNFMMQALAGKPLTIYGDGLQTRSFCYVSDLIDGIVRLAASAEHTPVNIGNPNEFTMLECAQEVLHVTGSNSATVPPASAPGRSHPPPPRHHQSAHPAWLAAEGLATRGRPEIPRLLPGLRRRRNRANAAAPEVRYPPTLKTS
jgi:nucleoside-diphosphate-sugar epimerase